MSFSKQLSNAAKEVLAESDEDRKAITIKLFNSVISDTPVDTGRARGNWQCSNGSPIKTEIDRVDKSGQAPQDEVINTVFASQADSTVYLTNNLPYAERLEVGSSTQAPNGMVRKNIARIEQIVRAQKSKK